MDLVHANGVGGADDGGNVVGFMDFFHAHGQIGLTRCQYFMNARKTFWSHGCSLSRPSWTHNVWIKNARKKRAFECLSSRQRSVFLTADFHHVWHDTNTTHDVRKVNAVFGGELDVDGIQTAIAFFRRQTLNV